MGLTRHQHRIRRRHWLDGRSLSGVGSSALWGALALLGSSILAGCLPLRVALKVAKYSDGPDVGTILGYACIALVVAGLIYVGVPLLAGALRQPKFSGGSRAEVRRQVARGIEIRQTYIVPITGGDEAWTSILFEIASAIQIGRDPYQPMALAFEKLAQLEALANSLEHPEDVRHYAGYTKGRLEGQLKEGLFVFGDLESAEPYSLVRLFGEQWYERDPRSGLDLLLWWIGWVTQEEASCTSDLERGVLTARELNERASFTFIYGTGLTAYSNKPQDIIFSYLKSRGPDSRPVNHDQALAAVKRFYDARLSRFAPTLDYFKGA